MDPPLYRIKHFGQTVYVEFRVACVLEQTAAKAETCLKRGLSDVVSASAVQRRGGFLAKRS